MDKPDRKIDIQSLILYPFLFVLEIILIPLVHNLDQFDPSQAIKPLIALLFSATGGYWLFILMVKDKRYAGYLVFLITLYFATFGYIDRFIQDQLANFGRMVDERVLLVIATVIIGILALTRVWIRLGGQTWLTSYLNLVIALGLLFPLYQLVMGFFDQSFTTRRVTTNVQLSSATITLDCTNTPDIYYIILDGYGRADMLADLYRFDNQPFIDYLESKGFYVASDSYTNYIQTAYSIPSSLNFNFIEPPSEGTNRQRYFADLMRHNQIMTALKRCSYRTIAIESGFYFTDHPEVDEYLEQGMGTNEFESLLLADSPIETLAQQLNVQLSEHSYEAHRRRVLFSFEQLGRLYQINEPKFILAHIISPHPPFVFDESGQPIEPQWGYYLGDGDDYQGNPEEYLLRYPAQVQFVNQKLQQTIDAILAHSTVPPVIIIQGDHGPGSRLVWDSPTQTCLWERTPILNAYYLPGGKSDALYPAISPVNTFRIVLNAYFGTNLETLPDSTYFTSHDYARKVIDITAERTFQANCKTP